MIPDLVLPQVGGIEKVVQLYIDEKPLLICRPDSSSKMVTYGNILEEILADRGITNYPTVNLGTDEQPIRGPSPIGDRYKVVGTGSCQNFGKFCSFYGESMDYKPFGINGIDERHLKEVQALHPDLSLVKSE